MYRLCPLLTMYIVQPVPLADNVHCTACAPCAYNVQPNPLLTMYSLCPLLTMHGLCPS